MKNLRKYFVSYYGHSSLVVYAESYEDAYDKAPCKKDIRIIEDAKNLDIEFWTPDRGRQFYELSNDDIVEIFFENFN